MKVSPRLQAIANMVEYPILVDVGCDHALLDIYLTLDKKITCVATDVNQNALKIARKNVNEYHLEDKIELKIGDGLENIEIQEPYTVVIAGMGTSTILNILKSAPRLPEQLILQSNNDLMLLRQEVIKLGYQIKDEKVVKEGKIFNVIINLERGNHAYSRLDLWLGPILRQKKESNTGEYYQYLIRKEEKILSQLPKKKIWKRIKETRKKKMIEKELKLF